ncbi:Retrovirus Polyprotein [Phytophthora megakarya]|uniref:Retrovirus Polyprotein n=1 Tax=Phytophthora megakarya TaxID=4795 RepID=A0A225VS02_9STRA|nr:Retrovirus Polyprotein [Phytophthora megakarya]
MLKAGLIRSSKSPHATPTFCIKKTVGWRIVHDYRAMNECTIRLSSPMPRKDSILDRMSGSFWVSCFDLLSGYYQLRMREKDILYTAFQTPDGLYEYVAIPIGLSNAPATFNRIVQNIFADRRESVATYFDDIYVFTKPKDVDSQLAAVRKVFERCRDKKLFLKLAKSTLCAPEIPCLGDFVGREGVRIDPDKVQPRTLRDLQSFLGTTVYVQRFCRSYSEISAPLFELVKSRKKSALEWTEEHTKAFQTLKSALSTTPVLALPDFSKPFCMRTDASRFAVGGVLFQRSEDDSEKPIAFCGRKMKEAELNYPTHEQEMIAIVHCLQIWRIYLLDGSCLVETDHHSLERVLKQKTINRRLCRWYDFLAEFNLRFRYIPGSINTVADAVSRRPDFEIDFLQQKQRQLNAKENLVRWISGDDSRIFIPEEAIELQNAILWELRDIACATLPGVEKTIVAVQQRFFWKRMHRKIRNYIATCESCQRNKYRTGKAPGLLHPLEIPTGRWSFIGMDFITGLPETKSGYDTIWVIADRLTKRANFILTVATISADELAELFVKEYVRHHGLPSDIVSYRDSKFTSKFWSSCAAILGTKLNLSTAHHQRTDGQVERINGILSTYLRHYVSGLQDDWDRYLALAEFAYNNRYQSSIEMSPFVADLGYAPRFRPILFFQAEAKSQQSSL